MSSIITTSLKEITLSSKFITLSSPNGEIEVDIKKLLKEPVHSDSAYFNATQIAKMYDMKVLNFLKLDGTKRYINALSLQSKGDSASPLKLVKTVRGRHHSGTWLHKKLILKFIAWVDIDFEVAMYDFMEKLIIHSN